MFAYGSLANRASRALEGSDDPASLVDVQGMAVAWDGCAANGTFSPLSIHRSNGDEALVHGIVFPVDEEAINNIDQRESEYIRQEISFDECVAAGVGAAAVGPLFHRTRPDSLEVHGGNLDEEKDAVFAYITPQRRNACRKAPISQAYIDVIVSGLLSEFGRMWRRRRALATTAGCSHALALGPSLPSPARQRSKAAIRLWRSCGRCADGRISPSSTTAPRR